MSDTDDDAKIKAAEDAAEAEMAQAVTDRAAAAKERAAMAARQQADADAKAAAAAKAAQIVFRALDRWHAMTYVRGIEASDAVKTQALAGLYALETEGPVQVTIDGSDVTVEPFAFVQV